MASSAKDTAEWVGGLVSMPASVTGQPASLLWMSADGAVLGHRPGRPGTLLGEAAESLRETIARPLVGRPHTPTRVRVASRDLADALRAGGTRVDIACAPTPEIDALLAVLSEELGDTPHDETFLSPEVRRDRVASFFQAAAELFRAAPWEVVPRDESLLLVASEALELTNAVVSIMGHMGQSSGLLFFSDAAAFEAHLARLEAFDEGHLREMPAMPPHLNLTFDHAPDVSTTVRKEVARHGWPVASPAAYPSLFAVTDANTPRPLSPRDFTIAEAVARALVSLVADKDALAAAWRGAAPVTRTFSVATHDGALSITLRAPNKGSVTDVERTGRLPTALSALEARGDEIDDDARRSLEGALIDRFLASPEGKSVTATGAPRLVVDIAAKYFGMTVADVTADDLVEILFTLFPATVSAEPSEARGLIEELRAFYEYLAREVAHPHAEACLHMLAGDTVSNFEQALSDVPVALAMRGELGASTRRRPPTLARKAKKQKERKALRKARAKGR